MGNFATCGAKYYYSFINQRMCMNLNVIEDDCFIYCDFRCMFCKNEIVQPEETTYINSTFYL